MSLFHPQIMEPYATYDEDTINVAPPSEISIFSKEYVNKPWHTPGGSRYYMTEGNNSPYYQDVITHRGHSHETKYVSDVLAGNDGYIPMIDGVNDRGEYVGSSRLTSSVSGKKEGFWYDMNRLEDGGLYSGGLDKELEDMINKENNWRNEIIRNNVRTRGWGKTSLGSDGLPVRGPAAGLNDSERKSFNRLAKWEASTIPLTEEGFGNNRALVYWNEKDYPIVTSNGLDLSKSFPQDGHTYSNIHKTALTRKLWGEFDTLKLDDPFLKAIARERKFTPRTSSSHIEKK